MHKSFICFLKLQHYWFGVEGTFGHIEISDNGGITWNNIVTFEKITKGSLAAPLDTTIDITSWAANKNNIKFVLGIVMEIRLENIG